MEPNLTEKITEELLSATDNGDSVDDVLKRYSRSKGPLYRGLAEATRQMEDRLYVFQDLSDKAAADYQRTETQARAMQNEVAELITHAKKLSEYCVTCGQKIKRQKEVLGQVEKLHQQGFSAPQLQKLYEMLEEISPPDKKPEEVINLFFQKVEHYGGISTLEEGGSRYKRIVKELQGEANRLTSEIESLTSQRGQVIAAIDILKENGLKQIESASQQTKEYIQTLVAKAEEVAALEFQAGQLLGQIRLAQIFASDNPAEWQTLSRHEIQRLLAGAILWSQRDENSISLPQPPKQLKDKLSTLSRGQITVAEALGWVLRGTFSPEQQEALAQR